MLVTPSTTFTAALEGAPTGIAGQLGVQILDANTDAVILARTSAGIAEAIATTGLYEIQLVSPAAAGEYIIVWDQSSVEYASETLTVGGVPPSTVAVPSFGGAVWGLPQVNATLTSVAAASVTEDWDSTDTTAVVWSGNAQAYVTRTDSREQTSGTNSSSVVTNRSVLLPRPVPVAIGSVLTLLSRDNLTEQITIRTIDYRTPPPGVVAPVKVTGEAA